MISPPKIQSTKDYGLFSTIDGNRAIDERRVSRMCDEIKAGLDLLPFSPVIVYPMGDELMIADGQHRFTCSQELGLPVYYVVHDGLDIEQIARMNSNSRNWSNNDFCACFAKRGIEDYSFLLEYKRKSGFSYSVCLQLLESGAVNLGGAGQELTRRFKSGKFKATEWVLANRLKAEIEKFKGYHFQKRQPFIAAVLELIKEEFDFCAVHDNLKTDSRLLFEHFSSNGYKGCLKRIAESALIEIDN